jgi:DNA-binding CsgD family transcriptional regulator
MKCILSLALLFIMICPSLQAQDPLIGPMIKAWKIADTLQSHRAQVFYDSLRLQRDTQQYKQIVQHLYAYLKEHPDKRIEARTILYQSLGAREFGSEKEPYGLLLQKAIKIAHELEDEHLTAEIYSLYAGMSTEENYSLYNLKAIGIQRRLGFSHFNYVQDRFFDASRALYLSQDYRQSINYGLECLEFRETDKKRWNPLLYIFQVDILGAAYKKLGHYDSTALYYQLLLDSLPGVSATPEWKKLWAGIAKGNIGYTLALQQKYSLAIPLLREYLENSIAYPDPANIALAQNELGSVYFMQRDYRNARAAWQEAYHWSESVHSLDNLLIAAKGMADIFRLTGQTDSAFFYNDRYHLLKDSLAANLNRSRLTTMNARMAFDNLQNSLNKTQAALSDVRFTRNIILAGIIIVAFIALLLYNRYRLKQKFRLAQMQRKRQLAEQEVENAREQISVFTKHIIEKNNLIETLQQQLSDKVTYQAPEEVAESLSQYTLFTDEEWEKFKVEFAKAYPEFLLTLRQQVEQITPAEERLAALIYLRLSTVQIANTLGISKDSVMRGKRRLRKRLNLPDPVTVEEYIYNTLAVK